MPFSRVSFPTCLPCRVPCDKAAFVDEQLGRLLDYLDTRQPRSGVASGRQAAGCGSSLAACTLVVFTSDHGSMLYDHGLEDKHSLHGQVKEWGGRGGQWCFGSQKLMAP